MRTAGLLIGALLLTSWIDPRANRSWAQERASGDALTSLIAGIKDRTPQPGSHATIAQLDQKLHQGGTEAEQIARQLLAARARIVADNDVLKVLDTLGGQQKPVLAGKLILQILRARLMVQGRPQARVVVGRLIVEDGKADPTLVYAQMPILEEGYFAGEVGDLQRPVCFRSHGYQDLDVSLTGKDGDLLYLAEVLFKPVPSDQQASFKGRIALDAAPAADGSTLTLNVRMGPVNTPHNGYSGRKHWPAGISVPISNTGEFSVTGLNPSSYTANFSAPKHVDTTAQITLAARKEFDGGAYRLYSSDLGFYVGASAPETPPLAWEKDYATALKRAQAEQKPLMIMMTATWCGPCKLLEETTLSDPWIRHFLSSFVVVKAYEDREVERTYGLMGYPTLVFTDSSGKTAHRFVGYMPTLNFSRECAKGFKALSIDLPPEMQALIQKEIIKLE